jgi:hypothetical protein
MKSKKVHNLKEILALYELYARQVMGPEPFSTHRPVSDVSPVFLCSTRESDENTEGGPKRSPASPFTLDGHYGMWHMDLSI